MSAYDRSGRPLARIEMLVRDDGCQIEINLTAGANNLPVVYAALDVIHGIADDIQGGGDVFGEGGDDGGGEDTVAPSQLRDPKAPLDDKPAAPGEVLQ